MDLVNRIDVCTRQIKSRISLLYMSKIPYNKQDRQNDKQYERIETQGNERLEELNKLIALQT